MNFIKQAVLFVCISIAAMHAALAAEPADIARKMQSLDIAKCRSVGSSFAAMGLVTKDANLQRTGERALEIFTQIGVAKHGSKEKLNSWAKSNKESLAYEKMFMDRAFADPAWGNDEFEKCQSILKKALV